MSEDIRKFYSKLKFPGPYTIEDLEFYDEMMPNKYLSVFNAQVQGCRRVLDVGCGSGFIVNFLARANSDIQFDAVDFSDAIDFAKNFSATNQIKNITYYKEDFLTWVFAEKYDAVICNGVLHHIPDYISAVKKIRSLTDGNIVIGIYNTYGKLFKKFVDVQYRSDTLYYDQEHCPFEVSFSDREFKKLFAECNVLQVTPSYKNHLVDLHNVFNYSNGGLTVYVLH